MLMPYTDALAEAVVAYLEAEGVRVVARRNFSVADNLAVGRLDPMRLVDEARSLDLNGVEAVVLSACVQMPSLPALLPAQRALGLPVTSTAACTVRGMLVRLGLEPVAPGGGAVLGDREGL
jgi:maleate isomerase